MHRLPVDTAILSGDTAVLPPDAVRHLRVLRPKPGEEVELFDGRGSYRVYRCADSRPEVSPLQAVSELKMLARGRFPVTLFACVTKGSRWDWTIEKATELGVARIVPVISDRCIVRLDDAERAAKRERWHRIAEDAARQSDAKWIPEVSAAVDFAAALPLVKSLTCFTGALTNPPSAALAGMVRGKLTDGARDLALFVGPEGDFTPEELSALLAISIPTCFGPMVLRAETAAIFGLSVIAAECEAFRKE